MSVKVSVQQLRQHLPEVLDRVASAGQEYVVQRNGKDCAVIVSARQWRRRHVATRLDALGPAYRVPREKQARAKALLTASEERRLTRAERRELKSLLGEFDAIMLRRASALEHLP